MDIPFRYSLQMSHGGDFLPNTRFAEL